MRYVEIPPPLDLARVVDAFWVVEGEVGDEIRVVPDGCCDLIDSGERSVYLNGPMSRAEIVELQAPTTRGIRLKPGTFLTLAGVDGLRSLRDRGVAVEVAAWSRGPGPSDHEVARELLGSEMLVRNCEVDAVLDAIAADSRRSLAEIYALVGFGERKMQRLFDWYVGLSPKQARQVLRHEKIARSLRVGDDGLAVLAAEHGYADQAHLTRNYRRLAGVPPGGYRSEFEGVGFVQDAPPGSPQNEAQSI